MGHGLMEFDTMASVREMPWHGRGKVLDAYPESVDEALEEMGLTWAVSQGDVFVALPPQEGTPGIYVPQMESNVVQAANWRANIREDTREVLGIVSNDYKVVPNRDAFLWLEALLGGEIQIETGGSLGNGRRVWVLALIPDLVEIGGDEIARFIFCANSHDGSMAVTAASTNVRIVCANTFGWALSKAEGCPRTYKFRHTGDMAEKLGEARKVMDITLRWNEAIKRLGDDLARQPITASRFDKKVVRPLIGFTPEQENEMRAAERKIAVRNREDNRELLNALFAGTAPDGDTTGNSPGTKWVAANAVAEYADHFRRVTKRTDQVQRSFEDQTLKQAGLELVLAA